MTTETERLTRVYAGYAESPAIRSRWDVSNGGNRAIVAERTVAIRAALAEGGYLPLAGRQVLEVGCGSGGVLAGLVELGAREADMVGVDLLPERVAEAGRRHPWLRAAVANGEALPFDEARFDLVLLFTVFSSILDARMASQVAAEVRRVLRPGGAVLWYDVRYDNPRNPHLRGMPRAAIAALFPGLTAQLRSTTLLPPLARRLGPATRLLYPALARVAPLRTHYLGLLR